MAGIDRRTPLGKREYAIVNLLAGHGLRAREVAGLRVDDVDLENRSLRLRQRKHGATTDLPLSDRAALAIRDYLERAIAKEGLHETPESVLSDYMPVF